MSVTPTKVLTTIAHSLVHTRRYPSVEEALRGMAIEEVRRKIIHYQRRIDHFKRKYGMDFQTFSASLEGKATISEEDNWMAWRAAHSMLADWEKAHRELVSNVTRS